MKIYRVRSSVVALYMSRSLRAFARFTCRGAAKVCLEVAPDCRMTARQRFQNLQFTCIFRLRTLVLFVWVGAILGRYSLAQTFMSADLLVGGASFCLWWTLWFSLLGLPKVLDLQRAASLHPLHIRHLRKDLEHKNKACQARSLTPTPD